MYQGRFKFFPIQDDEHLLWVMRYVERNALRANFVDTAEDWKWGSAYLRRLPKTKRPSWLGLPKDVSLPRNWRSLVNRPLTEKEAKAIQRCIVRAGTDPQDPISDVADPSEIGAILGVANGQFSPIARGAFVDLGKGSGQPGTAPILFNRPNQRYAGEAVYDTGTSQYDSDGVNDRGKNGVDDAPYFEEGEPNGIVDDFEEKASIPPYNVPLRGIKISIRAIEPNTNQVRQLTIIKSFIKE